MDRMLEQSDIQEHLHIGRDKARNLMMLKGFPAITIGSHRVVPESEYMKWIADNIGTKIRL